MKVIDIGEMAAQTGLSPSALRYYEEIGLIASIGRKGLRRQFDPQTILQLSLIQLGRSAGFSLDEIRGMFGADGQPDLPRPELRARADEIDRQIRDLTKLREALRHVADCPAPSHMECPTFRRLLHIGNRRGRPLPQSRVVRGPGRSK
ncbi:helix-turn-helix domain-containing protein [Chelativorans xinjiangense]|uniref:helix-turn-helix domain-containing protein n=1 Tax=Chelativorans xinjiangense TaxID=2681485 RepID=UPI0013587B6E|nr:helix-turn-helix domain-containing protein [Chelativorans xinjiangense]